MFKIFKNYNNSMQEQIIEYENDKDIDGEQIQKIQSNNQLQNDEKPWYSQLFNGWNDQQNLLEKKNSKTTNNIIGTRKVQLRKGQNVIQPISNRQNVKPYKQGMFSKQTQKQIDDTIDQVKTLGSNSLNLAKNAFLGPKQTAIGAWRVGNGIGNYMDGIAKFWDGQVIDGPFQMKDSVSQIIKGGIQGLKGAAQTAAVALPTAYLLKKLRGSKNAQLLKKWQKARQDKKQAQFLQSLGNYHLQKVSRKVQPVKKALWQYTIQPASQMVWQKAIKPIGQAALDNFETSINNKLTSFQQQQVNKLNRYFDNKHPPINNNMVLQQKEQLFPVNDINNLKQKHQNRIQQKKMLAAEPIQFFGKPEKKSFFQRLVDMNNSEEQKVQEQESIKFGKGKKKFNRIKRAPLTNQKRKMLLQQHKKQRQGPKQMAFLKHKSIIKKK